MQKIKKINTVLIRTAKIKNRIDITNIEKSEVKSLNRIETVLGLEKQSGFIKVQGNKKERFDRIEQEIEKIKNKLRKKYTK